MKQHGFARLLCAGTLFLAAASVASSGLPGPDHLIYGVPMDGETVLSTGVVSLVLDGRTDPLATYVIASDHTLGQQFLLRVPMDMPGERSEGRAQQGDLAHLLIGSQPAGTVTIGAVGSVQYFDADIAEARALPSISISDAEVRESDAAGVTAHFVISLSKVVTDKIRVDWVTGDRGAVGGSACGAGTDYVRAAGVATINPGDDSAAIDISICPDEDPEPDEFFTVTLSSPVGATLLDSEGLCTIHDDDTPPAVSIEDLSVEQPGNGQATASFTVELDHAWEEEVQIDYFTRDGEAAAGVEYLPDVGTLVFPVGTTTRNVDVSIPSDHPFEGEKNFFVELSDPVHATIGDGEAEGIIVGSRQFLHFVEADRVVVDGSNLLDGAFSTVVSPDGAHLYAVGRNRNTLLVFSRDAASGALGFLHSYTAADFGTDEAIHGLDGPESLEISPDGGTLWVAGFEDDAVAVFSRNSDSGDPDFGLLSYVESERDGVDDSDDDGPVVEGLSHPAALAVSPDGSSLYVACAGSDSVAVFSVDASTGALSFEEAEINGTDDAGDFGGEVDGIAGASDVAVSPDGLDVYVVGSAGNSIAVFERQADGSTGAPGHLSFVEVHREGVAGVEGLDGVLSLVLSPDGGQLYACSFYSGTIVIFSRHADGSLEFEQTLVREEISGAVGLAMAADGKYLYLSSWEGDSITVFRREEDSSAPGWGRLRFVETRREGIGGIDGLWGVLDLAVSPDDANVYAAGYLDGAVGVFSRDLDAPSGLEVHSTSHTGNVYSTQNVIDMSWSGATDGPLGSGIEGYSFLFDHQADTVVDETIEMSHGNDPHLYSSDPLEDGMWYFHIRACDIAGNCSGTIDAGPYLIDQTPPEGPADVHSTTHTPGVPNDANIVTMVWSAATDDGSGMDAYVLSFDHSPAAACPASGTTLPAAVEQISSPALADGAWYFHLCARDVAGNTGTPVVRGPYLIGQDQTPPRVTGVSAIAAPQGDRIDPLTPNESVVTQLVLVFSEQMDASDPALLDTASYRLISAGPDGEIQTAGCTAPAADDENVLIAGAVWDDATLELALSLRDSLPEGRYALLVCAVSGPVDLAGNPVDGNGDGVGGDDFNFVFDQGWSNLTANPNFDSGIAEWSYSDLSVMSRLGTDADGRSNFSAALQMSREVGGDFAQAASQCLDVSNWKAAEWVLTGRAMLSETTPVDAPPSRAWMEVSFYPAEDCAGSAESTFATNTVSDDTGGAWMVMNRSGERVPVDAASALLSCRWETPEGYDDPATAGFDSLGFEVRDPGPVLVSSTDAAALEGDSAPQTMSFRILLSRPSPDLVSVRLNTAGDTATAGLDYTETTGVAAFTPGVTAFDFGVEILPDLLDEPEENFRLQLSDPVGAVVQTAEVLGTIEDNDPMVTVSGAPVSSCEVHALVTVILELDAPSAFDVSFDWSTRDRTALAGQDYIAASGHLVIPAGSTGAEISIGLIDDSETEGDEFFEILLSNLENAVAGTPAVVTIIDNDPSQLPGDAWPDCKLDARDIAEIMRALSDPAYTPPGNTDCDGSGGSVDTDDLECLLARIHGN